jgi:hypothetical protein
MLTDSRGDAVGECLVDDFGAEALAAVVLDGALAARSIEL